MSIKDSTIAKVRQVPLTEVLEAEGIEFKRIGREALTLCPWHNDSSPSLTVNDDKNMCFCFACGGGSDAIAYIQQKFSLGFIDAIERIADKHQVQVEYDNLDPEEALRLAKQRKNALDAVKREQDAFRQSIRSNSGLVARQWLLNREITPDASRAFELGWADSGYFGGRVTVPIHDHRGTLVGFTGRQVDDNQSPQKYKNSASSELFDKGRLLFNEHRAVQAARMAGYLVFVEGHFDVISMWQYGIQNVVATQGTAGPPPEAINRLMRQCRRFVLCYDADGGGQKAIEHFIHVAGPLACKGELTVTIAQLPAGRDPDDCIREGIDLHGILEAAPQWLDWQIDCWLAGLDRSDTHHFSKVEVAIRQLVESIKSPALRQHYVDKAAKVLASDSKAAAKLAQNWSKSLPKLRHAGSWSRPVPSWIRAQVEKRVLRSYIHFAETRPRLRPLMAHLQGPSHLWLWNRLQELEAISDNLTVDMVLAILVVCEPQYSRTLRPIAMPTIKMTMQDGILEHAEHVLSSSIQTSDR
jgi:DNA primase